jgi:hypothetical protein
MGKVVVCSMLSVDGYTEGPSAFGFHRSWRLLSRCVG